MAKIAELIPDDRNINKGSSYGNSLLEKSLRKLGAGRSILIDKNNRILAGNKTIENAAAIGLEDLQIIESDGTKIIAVKRTDIDLNTKKGRELAIADNLTQKHNFIEDELITEELITEYEIDEDWGLKRQAKIVEEDDYKIPSEIETDIVLGDLFEIGQHRLLCGDSTNADDVNKLLDGGKPNLMVTDPPYGVNYRPKWRDVALGEANRQTGEVQNDDRVNWQDAYSLYSGDIAYVWHGDRHAKTVAQNLEDCGFTITAQIIWAKQHFAISRGDYHFQHEPCWYAVRKGKKHNWQGSRKESSLWEINNGLLQRGGDKEDKWGHGTQKPVECMARPIRNNSYERESVYDPFLGSGTTMVAAHQLNRKCYGMEIDPKYCQVIIERMKKLQPDIVITKNGQPYE